MIFQAHYRTIHLIVCLISENRKAIMARRNKLERKLDEYNHTMELIRTVVPIAVLILQIVILVKVI